MLQIGPGGRISEALMIQLARARAHLEARAEHIAAKQSPLLTGLKAEIDVLFKELDVLDTKAKMLSDEYLTKKASIEQKARSKQVGLEVANILVKAGIREEFAKNPSDKKLIASINALDDAYYATTKIALQEQAAQLTAAIDEHESKLRPIWKEKGDVVDKLLPLLARELEAEKLANQEVAALRLSPKGQTEPPKQQAQKAEPRPEPKKQSVGQGQEPTSISQKGGSQKKNNAS